MTDERIFAHNERLAGRTREIRDEMLRDHGCYGQHRARSLMEIDRLISLAFSDLAKLQRVVRAELDGHPPQPAVRSMLSVSLGDGLSASFGTPQAERTNP